MTVEYDVFSPALFTRLFGEPVTAEHAEHAEHAYRGTARIGPDVIAGAYMDLTLPTPTPAPPPAT
ncbi:hypothetical protein [Streptomyces daliensis]|uniref:Uncharacterized protein n=1 Tax=Streptomyces daliensis TaxID=299421 RepID=A0A8T4J191_9ACTN|nr:hypothetical protein [Streptomyces daliensis]